ncbi:MAG: M56 family metallopeptidase [Oscillospiraceae bacterium]
MFDKIFLQILNMSFTASLVIAVVLVARLLLMKAPKLFSYVLWSAALFRLICPFSLESGWSLLPTDTTPISTAVAYSQAPQISTGVLAVDNTVNPALSVSASGAGGNPLQIWISAGEIIWLIGIAALILFSIVSLLRLRRNLVGAVKLRDNVYLADHTASPFVIGLICPKIYLPSNLSELEREYIILHEQTHIRRCDHIVKLIAFSALAVHWFNPLVWLAFVLCNKDMEMSCDESVMKHMDTDIRCDYSASLLRLATGRKFAAGTPLAFGEGNTKERIKNVLNYKRPAFRIVVVGAIAVIAVCIGLTANPRRGNDILPSDDVTISKTAWQYIVYQIDDNGNGNEINGAKITKLELAGTYRPIFGKSVGIYSLAYSLFLNENDGWVSGSTDLGSPYLFVVNNNGSPQIIGIEYNRSILADGDYSDAAKKEIAHNEVLNFTKQSTVTEPFSEKEINAAMEVVKNNYTGDGQLLINLWYDREKYQTDLEDYKGNTLYGMSEAAERGDLLTLYSDIYFLDPSGSADGLMRGWKTILIRDSKDDAWKIIDQGY